MGLAEVERMSITAAVNWWYVVPVAMIATALVVAALLVLARRRKPPAPEDGAQGRCFACGYDLRGDYAGGCPECGWNRKGGPFDASFDAFGAITGGTDAADDDSRGESTDDSE